MTRNPPDMKIRLSAELRRQVEAAAKSNNRTLNSEIVSRLEASFRTVVAGDKMEASTTSDVEIGQLLQRIKWLEERMSVVEEQRF
ncbi:Arc family DNA-binding protein [Neorhizobium sp. LjRoot104]|uniref:Arc family DNA-binding protein n=1 Tax=Neorhizobium sp. LjRoot104 TaxID=3342254 RepID=UPI003F4F93C2